MIVHHTVVPRIATGPYLRYLTICHQKGKPSKLFLLVQLGCVLSGPYSLARPPFSQQKHFCKIVCNVPDILTTIKVNHTLWFDPGLINTIVSSVDYFNTRTAEVQQGKEIVRKGTDRRAVGEWVLGLAHCYSIPCQEIFSNCTVLKINRNFMFQCIMYFSTYPTPGVIISLCWDVGSGLLKVTLQGKGQPGCSDHSG